jgi:hypothetical protein
MVVPGGDGDVTQLLARWAKGERAALDALMPVVYASSVRSAAAAWDSSSKRCATMTSIRSASR